MNRLFQGAATVDSILRGDLIEGDVFRRTVDWAIAHGNEHESPDRAAASAAIMRT
jgi:hypothetical protein